MDLFTDQFDYQGVGFHFIPTKTKLGNSWQLDNFIESLVCKVGTHFKSIDDKIA